MPVATVDQGRLLGGALLLGVALGLAQLVRAFALWTVFVVAVALVQAMYGVLGSVKD
mgnify:CR=1 FL=1